MKDSLETEPNLRLVERFKHLHGELVKLVDNFPPEKRTAILFDQWSLREVLVHMTAWNRIVASSFQMAMAGEEPILTFVPDGELDGFNARAIEQARNLSWDDVYRNFVASGYALSKLAGELPEGKWATTIDPGKEVSLKRDFVYAIEHYQNEHAPQLRNFLDL